MDPDQTSVTANDKPLGGLPGERQFFTNEFGDVRSMSEAEAEKRNKEIVEGDPNLAPSDTVKLVAVPSGPHKQYQFEPTEIDNHVANAAATMDRQQAEAYKDFMKSYVALGIRHGEDVKKACEASVAELSQLAWPWPTPKLFA